MNIVAILTRLPIYYILFRALYGRYIVNRFIFMLILSIIIMPINMMLYKKLKLYTVRKDIIVVFFYIIAFWISFFFIGNRFDTVNKNSLNLAISVSIAIAISIIVIFLYSTYNQKLYVEVFNIIFIIWVIIMILIFKELAVEIGKNTNILPRIKGTYGNPNQTSLFLNLYMMSLIIFSKDTLNMKRLIFIMKCLTGIAILLTLSRSGMICYVIINILFIEKENYRDIRKIIKNVIFVISLIMIGFFIANNLGLYIDRWSLNEGAGTNGRLDALISGIRIFIKNPVFGVGLNRCEYYSVIYGSPNPIKPHNTIIFILAETGVLPASILICMIVYILKISITYKIYNSLKAILVIMVMSLFNHNLHLYTTTWITILLILIYDIRKLDNVDDEGDNNV